MGVVHESESQMAMGSSNGKKVLLTSDADEISNNIALHLARRGCRSVLSNLLLSFPVTEGRREFTS